MAARIDETRRVRPRGGAIGKLDWISAQRILMRLAKARSVIDEAGMDPDCPLASAASREEWQELDQAYDAACEFGRRLNRLPVTGDHGRGGVVPFSTKGSKTP